MRSPRTGALWLWLVVGVALFFLIYPLYVIRPFRVQGDRELALALFVLRWNRVVTLVLAAAGVLLALRAWEGSGWLRRTGSLVALLLLGGVTLGARVNIFEKMFRPVSTAQVIPAVASRYPAAEMMMAIRHQAAARAYPIRVLAYHHVFNDELAGLPVVATY